MSIKQLLSLSLAMLLLAGSTALAEEKSPVTITTQAVVEKKVATPEGRLEIKRVPATEVLPGATVIFVNTISNTTDTAAENIAVSNPVPRNMTYLDGSATAKNLSVTFSVDGGKSFDLPGKLTVPGPDGKPRPAVAADYTDIRWQFTRPLPAKATEQVEFQAKVR